MAHQAVQLTVAQLQVAQLQVAQHTSGSADGGIAIGANGGNATGGLVDPQVQAAAVVQLTVAQAVTPQAHQAGLQAMLTAQLQEQQPTTR